MFTDRSQSRSQSIEDDRSDSLSAHSDEQPQWALKSNSFTGRESRDSLNVSIDGNNGKGSKTRQKSIECSSIEVKIIEHEIISRQNKPGNYVVFIIQVTPGGSKKWNVHRRYNDFYYLDQQLRKSVNELSNFTSKLKSMLPSLPRKRYFGSSTEPRFIEDRRVQLEEYLQSLIKIPQVWVKSDLAKFLDNESNSMTFIWNFDRVRKMQEVLNTMTIENKQDTAKLTEELSVSRDQVSELQLRINRMELMFAQQNQNNSTALNSSGSPVASTAVSGTSVRNSYREFEDTATVLNPYSNFQTRPSIVAISVPAPHNIMDMNGIQYNVLLNNAISTLCQYDNNSSPQNTGIELLCDYFDQIIAPLMPTSQSLLDRYKIFEYLRSILFYSLGVHIFPIDCSATNSYMPNDEIEITGLFIKPEDESWFVKVNETLCSIAFGEYHSNSQHHAALLTKYGIQLPNSPYPSFDQNESTKFTINNVSFVNSDNKQVKTTINGINVVISANSLQSLYIQLYLEKVDQFVGKNHLFKRSIFLIKSWCIYESSTYSLGSGSIMERHNLAEGRLSLHSLKVMICFIFHAFGKRITHPLQALYYFLYYYSNFDWNKFALSVYGPVPIYDENDLSIHESFLKSFDNFIPHEILNIYRVRYKSAKESIISNHIAPYLPHQPYSGRGVDNSSKNSIDTSSKNVSVAESNADTKDNELTSSLGPISSTVNEDFTDKSVLTASVHGTDCINSVIDSNPSSLVENESVKNTVDSSIGSHNRLITEVTSIYTDSVEQANDPGSETDSNSNVASKYIDNPYYQQIIDSWIVQSSFPDIEMSIQHSLMTVICPISEKLNLSQNVDLLGLRTIQKVFSEGFYALQTLIEKINYVPNQSSIVGVAGYNQFNSAVANSFQKPSLATFLINRFLSNYPVNLNIRINAGVEKLLGHVTDFMGVTCTTVVLPQLKRLHLSQHVSNPINNVSTRIGLESPTSSITSSSTAGDIATRSNAEDTYDILFVPDLLRSHETDLQVIC